MGRRTSAESGRISYDGTCGSTSSGILAATLREVLSKHPRLDDTVSIHIGITVIKTA